MSAPAFRVAGVELYERPVAFRLPFRFGSATVTGAPQAFARVRIEGPDGTFEWGASAQLMVPKWFDKTPGLSHEQNFAQLRRSLALAREAYVDRAPRTAFGHFAVHHDALIRAGAAADLPPLAANFGAAVIDCAIVDALGRVMHMSFADLLRTNVPGIDPARMAPDLAGFGATAFLQRLSLPAAVDVRHTVGMADRLADDDPGEPVGDGLPESLATAIARYASRWFKLKLSGDPAFDVGRLARIAAILDRDAGDYRVTLDGNEQYADIDAAAGLLDRLARAAATARLARAIAFVEQPIPRAHALDTDVRALARLKPVIIDEADARLDAFVTARALGYAGVSSKSCKGVYRSILNAMRCARWNAEAGNNATGYFISGEDLTAPAGLAVQQDTALAAVLGIGHIERNGHHYIDGFAGQGAPADEAAAFGRAHPDLYEPGDTRPRLRIEGGRIALGSLDAAGFASAVHPDFRRLTPMAAD